MIRRYLAAHPLTLDLLVAGAYLVPAMAGGVVVAVLHPGVQQAVHLVLSGIAGVALVARRHRPAVVFAIATILLGASVFLGRDMDVLPTLIALYALAVYRSIRSAWIAVGVTAAVTIVGLTAEALLAEAKVFTPLQTAAIPSAILVLSFSVVAVLIGSNVGGRRRYLDALIDRARQLARERDQQAEIAAAAERSRIAREMHDIVSHSLTVMITLADGSARVAEAEAAAGAASGAGRAQAGTPPAETMRMVAETGRGALADMRRLLGVLRDGDTDGASREPQPGVGDLGDLVGTFRVAGLPVRITVSGTPPEDVGQQLTVFRVVQEGLTNALRYAISATAVRVVIVFRPERVIVTIDDDAALRPTTGHGSGRGLIGLRERVSLYGGTLEAGPRRGGGWRVRAAFDAVRDVPVTSATAPAPASGAPAPAAPASAEPASQETP